MSEFMGTEGDPPEHPPPLLHEGATGLDGEYEQKGKTPGEG